MAKSIRSSRPFQEQFSAKRISTSFQSRQAPRRQMPGMCPLHPLPVPIPEAWCPKSSAQICHNNVTSLNHPLIYLLSVDETQNLHQQEGKGAGSLKKACASKPCLKVHFHLSFLQWSCAMVECKHRRNRQNRELRIWTPCFRSNLQRMHIPNIRVAQQGSKLLMTAWKSARVTPIITSRVLNCF